MDYHNNLIKRLARHKALILIVLLVCLLMLYGPKKFEYLCPVQEIRSCKVYEDIGFRRHQEVLLTKEQENELIALLTQQYFRCVVFQNASTASGPARHELWITLWCEEGDDEGLCACSVGVDSLGAVYGYGVKSSKRYVGICPPFDKIKLYKDVMQIIGNKSLCADLNCLMQHVVSIV